VWEGVKPLPYISDQRQKKLYIARMKDVIRTIKYLTPALLFLVILLGTQTLDAGEGGQQDYYSLGKIAFSSYMSENWEIWAINPDGTNPVQLTNTASEKQYPAWSAGGSKIAFATSEGEIWIGEPGKEFRKIPSLPKNCTHPAWSPDGAKIAFTAYTFTEGKEESDLYIAFLQQGKVHKLMEQEGVQRHPAWSPDGSLIVYSVGYWGTVGTPIEDLWIVDSVGTNPRRLVSKNGSNTQPEWSPDGDWIAFASDRTGNMEIWIVDRYGKNQKRLTNDKAYDADPSWSPDGSKICFVSTRSGKLDLWIMDRDGTNPHQATGLSNSKGDNKEPQWSR
jgi:TolB protein